MGIRVEKLYLSRKKKTKRVEIEEGLFIEDFGLEGDAYSRLGADRQVTVLSSEGRSGVESDPLKGLCFERFVETVRISGIDMDLLSEGTVLRLGEAVFEVTRYRKKCYGECDIVKSGRTCSLVPGARFLKVIKTGIVRKGDAGEVIK